jgi:hypothetical protein
MGSGCLLKTRIRVEPLFLVTRTTFLDQPFRKPTKTLTGCHCVWSSQVLDLGFRALAKSKIPFAKTGPNLGLFTICLGRVRRWARFLGKGFNGWSEKGPPERSSL